MAERRGWLAMFVGSVLLVAPGALAARAAAADGKPVAGARTLGDPLLPQLGNGGYDVGHYRIELDYDPVANGFNSATTTIRATADASSRSSASTSRTTSTSPRVTRRRPRGRVQPGRGATPDLSPDPDGHPADEARRRRRTRRSRPKAGPRFHRGGAATRGAPQHDHRPRHVDRGLDPRLLSRSTHRRPATAPSSSTSRWAPRAGSRRTTTRPTRRPSTRSSPCPAPRRRSASASSSRAPTTATARRRGTGREDDPTATYLTTATVGDFIYTRGVDDRDLDRAHAAGVQRHRQQRHARRSWPRSTRRSPGPRPRSTS